MSMDVEQYLKRLAYLKEERDELRYLISYYKETGGEQSVKTVEKLRLYLELVEEEISRLRTGSEKLQLTYIFEVEKELEILIKKLLAIKNKFGKVV